MSSDEKQSTTQSGAAAQSPTKSANKPQPETVAESENFVASGATPALRFSTLGLITQVIGLALIVLLGGGAYYWAGTVYHKDLAGTNERLEALDSARSSLIAEIDTASGGMAALAEEIETLRSNLDTTVAVHGDLQRSLSALYERETHTSVDWILAEAEYLVLAATQRVALERDVETAIAALRAADLRLHAAQHPDLIPIRDQIITDVTALEAVSRPDIEGLAIYLASAIELVDELPTKPIAEAVAPFANVRSGEYEAVDWRQLAYWRQLADDFWSDLIHLVEIKDADLSDSVLFDPELRYFLRQNLKLELASARLAVLRRDSANLAASSALVGRLLDAYYDVNQPSVANIIQRLAAAEAIELNPAIPNITGSLDVIRTYRASRAAKTGPAR